MKYDHLTDEIRYVFRLFVVFDGHEHRVEEHQHDDEPIEPLRFHHASDPEPEPFFGPPHGRADAFFPHSVFERGRPRETCGFTHKIYSHQSPGQKHVRVRSDYYTVILKLVNNNMIII